MQNANGDLSQISDITGGASCTSLITLSSAGPEQYGGLLGHQLGRYDQAAFRLSVRTAAA
jgi:hypothetical protein